MNNNTFESTLCRDIADEETEIPVIVEYCVHPGFPRCGREPEEPAYVELLSVKPADKNHFADVGEMVDTLSDFERERLTARANKIDTSNRDDDRASRMESYFQGSM